MTRRLVPFSVVHVIDGLDVNCRRESPRSTVVTRGAGPAGTTATSNHPRHRSTDMHLLVQELSRDRMRQAQRDMEAIRLASRLRTARKLRDRRRTVRH